MDWTPTNLLPPVAPWNSHPLFLGNLPSKNWDLFKHLPFLQICLEVQPLPPSAYYVICLGLAAWSMLLNVFCFLFLFRLFSFFAEMCNRNTNCHCAFTRSQSALKACIRLGIEILWLVWCINDALITLSTREWIV